VEVTTDFKTLATFMIKRQIISRNVVKENELTDFFES